MDDKFEPVEIEDSMTTFFNGTPGVWMITDIFDSRGQDSYQLILSRAGAIKFALTILNRALEVK